MSLNNLASHLASIGQRHEALETAQEAVAIRRNLVECNPATYAPDLAISLNNLAIWQAENNHLDVALMTIQEATNLYRELFSKHLQAFSGRFATTLETHARILDHCGNAAEATRIRQKRDEVLKRMKDLEEGGV